MIRSILTFFIILFIVFAPLSAQKAVERDQHSAPVDQTDVRSLMMDANAIRTVVYNTGSISGPGVMANVMDLVWHGLGYGYEFGFVAGALVPSALNPVDSIRFIVDGFGASNRSTADGDFAPDGVTKWGWLPTPRYSNPATKGIANNRDPSTWPAAWSGWNGKNGDAIADLELLYEMNDSTDAEFPYYPFPADTMRRGLGLTSETRYYQFAHPNLEDILFTFMSVKNVSPKPLTKMVVGVLGDPHIGGANNYLDDAQDFDHTRGMFYSWDPDKMSDIPSLAPGYFAYRYMATPEDNGVTSASALPWGGYFRPKNDTLMYSRLSEGVFNDFALFSKDSNSLGDYILIMGSGFFSLAPGESQTLGTAYLFATDLASLNERADLVDREYIIRFRSVSHDVAITSPVPGSSTNAGTVQIQWTDTALDNDTTIALYYSNTVNEQWKPIAQHVPNNGSYTWNIAALPDGIFYKVHIIKEKNGQLSYDSTGGYFTVNHPGDAAPEGALLTPKNLLQLSGTVPVTWIAGDADGDPVSVSLQFSSDNGANYSIIASPGNSGNFLFNTRTVVNTSLGRLKLTFTANGKSTEIITNTFRIGNFYTAVTDTASLKHTAGIATGSVIPGIIDSSAVTGHSYRITFDSSNGGLTYTLHDLTSAQSVLTNAPLTANNGTGTLVHGMRVWFENHPLQIDTGKSRFVSTPANIKRLVSGTFSAMPKRPMPVDLFIQFGSLDTNSAGAYVTPLDSFPSTINSSLMVKVPFSITDLTNGTKFTARIQELSSLPYYSRKTARWDLGERIVIISPPTTTAIHAVVEINKTDYLKPEGLSGGEQFHIITQKPFTPADVFEFTADVKYGKPTGAQQGPQVPTEFRLEQNFPNPFNPETTVRFSVPYRSMTSVTVYDAVGREVAVLVNEELSQGNYAVQWNGMDRFGQQSASGIYFYRMRSGAFVSTKKMLLLR